MGTSVPSQRVFSITELTVTNKRSQFDPELLDHVIFMNKALKRRYAEVEKKPNNIPLIKEEACSAPSQVPNMEVNATRIILTLNSKHLWGIWGQVREYTTGDGERKLYPVVTLLTKHSIYCPRKLYP